MSIEAYYPEMLSINNIKVNDFKDHIMQLNLEIGRFDGMLRYNPQKEIVQAFLRAEEVLSAASLDISELSFDEYLDKLLDRGYGADDLNEIRFMVDYYKEQNSIIEERGFSLELLNDFQEKLLDNRKQRTIAQTELYRKRQIWLVEATEGLDVRNHMQPSQDRISELMDNLDNFIRKSKLHPLVTAAIAYGQLVMIHPWRYVNGRITGTIIPYVFNFLGITRERNFYISAVICKDKKKYYHQLVKLFKTNNWQAWINYFLDKVNEGLMDINQKKTAHILETYKNYEKLINSKRSPLKGEYLDAIISKPIFTPKDFEIEYDFVLLATLYNYLSELREKGYLVRDNRKKYMNYMFTILRDL